MTPPERVAAALAALGLPAEVRTFPQSTATAEEAAAAVGCAPGQIIKTLFFLADGRPTMVLMAGDRQVDTAALAEILGVSRKRLKMGTPEEVRQHTGYEVGGVAPVGWPTKPDVVIDDSLRRFATAWAAAGAPNAVFAAGVEALAAAIGGQWAAIAKERA
ncbi:aminoacyl-tRNA deacylase [Tepidiforma bonchosmolovskayae]|jgi:prolyl-tRNA editing enzyme YbaK/EbsC (Cys-tRNA(Pro) deacylase)|uniref:YbaK/EbsC family protein n=1 Tax=Tepidiforma bonchosmolovskayae TaxID=2601677 RepID=A0ABX6C3D9_9CHLR|nr:YbaK/EbsC family protein [Tepidiforma bonchosmolovskayae]QFG03671.1 YbaK/EbsC family protein [Tepidiforma bonchosmolovskayae]